MRYPILIALVLLVGCAVPDALEPDRCLNGSIMLQSGEAHACDGPRGCYLLSGGLACDASVIVEGMACLDPWQLWCGPGEVLRCEPAAEGTRWRSLEACPGGCWTSPLRCAAQRP